MKENKGITLIALVITIIVLLILAGVSIAMLSEDNSILKNASTAGTESKVANAKEAVALKMNEIISDWYKTTYVDGSQTLDLANYINTTLVSSEDDGYTVESGNITIDGSTVKGTIDFSEGNEGKITWTNTAQ